MPFADSLPASFECCLFNLGSIRTQLRYPEYLDPDSETAKQELPVPRAKKGVFESLRSRSKCTLVPLDTVVLSQAATTSNWRTVWWTFGNRWDPVVVWKGAAGSFVGGVNLGDRGLSVWQQPFSPGVIFFRRLSLEDISKSFIEFHQFLRTVCGVSWKKCFQGWHSAKFNVPVLFPLYFETNPFCKCARVGSNPPCAYVPSGCEADAASLLCHRADDV
jgi:hypothetical protein